MNANRVLTWLAATLSPISFGSCATDDDAAPPLPPEVRASVSATRDVVPVIRSEINQSGARVFKATEPIIAVHKLRVAVVNESSFDLVHATLSVGAKEPFQNKLVNCLSR